MAPRISLCLIVKKEEATLPRCLQSAAGLVQETIVVDTGSTDRTRDIAASLGARVFDFPWVDSFGEYRTFPIPGLRMRPRIKNVPDFAIMESVKEEIKDVKKLIKGANACGQGGRRTDFQLIAAGLGQLLSTPLDYRLQAAKQNEKAFRDLAIYYRSQ